MANVFLNEILSEQTPSKRAAVISRILDVAYQSYEALRNFELMVMILGVLECTAVFRLKKTWDVVEKTHPGRRKKFKDLVGIGGRNVMLVMYQYEPPLVPHLGGYMREMVNWRVTPSTLSYPDCDDEHINVSKFRSILKVLHHHNASQAKYFNIPIDDDLQQCLRQPVSSNEDLYLRQSHNLE